MLANAAGMASIAAGSCKKPKAARLYREAAGLLFNAQGMLSVGDRPAAEGLTTIANAKLLRANAIAEAT